MSHGEHIDNVKSFIKVVSDETKEQLERFCRKCTYVSGHASGDKPYEELRDHVQGLEHGKTDKIRIFYLALPPSIFVSVSGQLRKFCYSDDAESRILVSLAFKTF